MTSARGLRIDGRAIGQGHPCYVIAEIGINHNGRVSVAKRLIDVAAEAGADAVKFQKRSLDHVYRREVLDDPRKGEQGLQYMVPILKEFELETAEIEELFLYARERGITCFCTPFDEHSVELLEHLGVPAYKIGSPDLTNMPLIRRVADTGKPLLLSTGMSTEEEVRHTISYLADRNVEFGLFHCVSTYPASPEEINLRFARRLEEWSGRPVGYSGHEKGLAISLAAVALGASMLERHLTLDCGQRGPDHTSSLDPASFAELVESVREVEVALGQPHRWLTRGEILNRRVLGKSLVVSRAIPAGTALDASMLLAKSPGMGVSPQQLSRFLGRELQRSLGADEMLRETDVSRPAAPSDDAISIGLKWGVIARFGDVDRMLTRFPRASIVEFHVSDRDLDTGGPVIPHHTYALDLVVHAPEYCHDNLVDLCSQDDERWTESIRRIQATIDLTRRLGSGFQGIGASGPKVIVHVGGMSAAARNYDGERARARLLKALSLLDMSDVDLLLENLPPFPWFFGGKWYGHVMVHADDVVDLCRATGLGLCFDTSHAMLACNQIGGDLIAYTRSILAHVRHIHASDGAGTSGEGLQIGEGQVDFGSLLPLLWPLELALVPEVWLGHHNDGDGFHVALQRLTEIAARARAIAPSAVGAELAALIVPTGTTVADTLKAIDRNTRGFALVADDGGSICGLVTDGDIRRALLRGTALDRPVDDVMVTDFVHAREDDSPESIRGLLSQKYRIAPVLDGARRLVRIADLAN